MVEILEKLTEWSRESPPIYRCKCCCGKIFDCARPKRAKSCGCSRRKSNIGDRFNKLVIINFLDIKSKWGTILCEYQCDCGNIGQTTLCSLKKRYSCGCTNKLIKGENHPWYNKNLTQEERNSKRRADANLRKLVLYRDNYTCSYCNKTKTKIELDIHHINGYRWCEEGRKDPKNVITFCKECHINFHKIYGNKNNTLFQLIEFMEN
jgi:5-methylcytosine-specific restriction endonuclease McrA